MKKKNLDIFFEISSKTGDNVITLFERVGFQLITKSIQMQNIRSTLLKNQNQVFLKPKKKRCC